MAKLHKRPKSHSALPTSSPADVPRTGSTGPPVLPAIQEQAAFNVQLLHPPTNHERHGSDSEGGLVFRGHQRTYDPRSVLTRAHSPTSPLVKTEQQNVTTAQRRPSPLRISQEAAAESEAVVAGPSDHGPGPRRDKCGPSCQKCGRPRRAHSPGLSSDEITRAPATTHWPLQGPGNGIVTTGTPGQANDKATLLEAQPAPEALPSIKQRSKRRKYFSLPAKYRPSFKGPTDLASNKGKAVQPQPSQEPSREKARPVSAPSPTKSAFEDPADVGTPNPQRNPPTHVHFARDDHLAHFAADIRLANGTTSSSHQQVTTSSTAGPALPVPGQQDVLPTLQLPLDKPQPAAQLHPQALRPAQPPPRPNSAVLYEWPLITTLVNQPAASPSPSRPVLTNARSRSSLSISRRPSRRTSRPYHNPHVHAPIPGRTSSRHKALLQQSRKASYIVDQASNSSRESISISILGMLQGFPGGELAASAKTGTSPDPLSDRPSLLRLQTYPADAETRHVALHKDARDDEITRDPYSPSDYGSEEDSKNDDDDPPQPVTPPQSDFSLASYAIGDDKKLSLRPASTVTQTSFFVGDDRHLPLATASTPPDLTPAPAPRALSMTPSPLASPSPPVSAPSSQPTELTASSQSAPGGRDSEGMIPVSRLSVADLPEVAGDGSGDLDEDIDPDWFSWGALPGSYGGAGMWVGSSPGLEGSGRAELGAVA